MFPTQWFNFSGCIMSNVNFRTVKIMSLVTLMSLVLSACGGNESSEGLPKHLVTQAIPDADNDGVADSEDAFPSDPTESVDSDGDGFGDNADAFPQDASEWADIDANGIGDNADATRPVNEGAGAPTGAVGDCAANTAGVNWNALMTENCRDLSDYNLFQDASDPTSAPTAGGIPFDLNIPLFTDYATKYRYAFVPEGMQAKYTEHEVLDFPVGTVLVKTFTMPESTSNREGAELVIETRLLIHRESGWMALPYYWDRETDAKIAIAGKSVPVTTYHNGVQRDFTYIVPDAQSCVLCHQILPITQDDEISTDRSVFKPIGPKARNMNKDFVYGDKTVNQLTHWVDNGILTGLPDAVDNLEKLMLFRDDTIISQLSKDELTATARGYLDINCAHCHRSELSLAEQGYAGSAGYTGLQMEYNREFAQSKFGVCKQPIANRDDTNRVELLDEFPETLAYDVVPQRPERSYLLYRMTSSNPNQRMAPLGRSIHHTEGVDLISAWINTLDAADCSE